MGTSRGRFPWECFLTKVTTSLHLTYRENGGEGNLGLESKQ